MNFVIKVADFGLSESVGSKEYFRQDKDASVKLPLKWLAPESIEDGVFSEKSDVVIRYVACCLASYHENLGMRLHVVLHVKYTMLHYKLRWGMLGSTHPPPPPPPTWLNIWIGNDSYDVNV